MKTTYNKICFGICLLGGALAGSCTGDYMDYNRNWAEVSPEETERDEYLVSSLLGGMQSNVIPVEEHLNQFTECLMGCVWGGYFADSQVWANSFSYFNPSQDWLGKMYLEIIPNVYSNWLSLQAATKDEAILAVGQIVKAAAFQRVTDTYGPIPYSRIGSDGKVTAPLDTQREVYEKIFEELDAAVATLTEHRTSSISAAADKVYSGDIEKWIKFANSLKLRMAMRLVYAAPATAEQRAKEAVDTTDGKLGVMTSNDDNAQLSGINVNPFYKVAYEYNGGETRISADLLNYMKSWNDPRISAYAKKSTFTDAVNDYWGLRIGNEYPITSGQAYSNRSAVVDERFGGDVPAGRSGALRLGYGRYGRELLSSRSRTFVREVECRRCSLLPLFAEQGRRLQRPQRAICIRARYEVRARMELSGSRVAARADHHAEMDRQLPVGTRSLGRVPPHGLSEVGGCARESERRRCRRREIRPSSDLSFGRVQNQRSESEQGCRQRPFQWWRQAFHACLVGLQSEIG